MHRAGGSLPAYLPLPQSEKEDFVMSEIERIQAAAAHPENWKLVKNSRRPARRLTDPLRSLMASWPGTHLPQALPRTTAERIAETEENQHG